MRTARSGEQDIRMPTDSAGFARRLCPRCGRGFKVTARGDEPVVQAAFLAAIPHINAQEVPGAPVRWCPYCGHGADAGGFLTPPQRAYLEACARRLAGEVRYEVLRHAARPEAGGGTTYVVLPPTAAPPVAPPEPDDMSAEPLLCCGDEVKLESGWNAPFYCHHCRARHRGDAP